MNTLDNQLKGAVQSTQLVVLFDLDGQRLAVGNRAGMVAGLDVFDAFSVSPEVPETGGSLSLVADALPDWVSRCYWSNRKASVWRLPDLARDFDRDLLFSGVVSEEPELTNGLMRLRLALPASSPVQLPAYGVVDSETYPTALSVGDQVPEVYGELRGELLNTQQPISQVLSGFARVGDRQLLLQNAEAFPASGSVWVDGHKYDYSSRTDKALLGVEVLAPHYQGTAVALDGECRFLAAGNALGVSDVRSGDQRLSGYQVSNGQVVFPRLPVLPEQLGEYSAQLQFDQVHPDSSATNSVNAIQAATAIETDIQALDMPLVIGTGEQELTRSDVINFPLPGQDRILRAAYTVQYSVSSDFQGDATVMIGGQLAWAMESGAVVYAPGELTFSNQQDSSSLAVLIQRDSGGAAVELTVSAAARTLVLGNLDNNAFATVSRDQSLVVEQTTDNPNYGKINRARLAVEWMPTGALSGLAEVHFAGKKVGLLDAQVQGGGSQSFNISADVISQGSASLVSRDVGGLISQAAQILNSPSVQSQTYVASYQVSSGAGLTAHRLNLKIKPPENVRPGNHAVWFYSGDGDYANSVSISDSGGRSVSLVENGAKTSVFYVTSASQVCEISNEIVEGLIAGKTAENTVRPTSIRVEWNIDPIGVQGGGVSGSPALNDGRSSVSGVNVRARVNNSGSSVVVDTPVQAQSIINQFDLPVSDWGQLTDQLSGIWYNGGGSEQLRIFRFWLVVDYEAVKQVPVKAMTAQLSDARSNPVDVLADLYGRVGKQLHPGCVAALRGWFERAGWRFARRVADRQEVAPLIVRALDQAGLMAADTPEGVWLLRLLDIGGPRREVPYDDCLAHPTIRCKRPDKAFTHLLVKCGEHVVQRTPENNHFAAVGRLQAGADRHYEINAGWLSDAKSAGLYADLKMQLGARLGRVTELPLPHPYVLIQKGHLVVFEEALWRVLDVKKSHSKIIVSIEELVE
ncbi:hypothetical protein [Aliamphritea hakodatensis]|uniref:hypothetical protein n=1 Tax=Aliamphritea hakodatensis TaxID=2895352 RepID=UPI0022FD7245|nr:hypothetical protein [Aliamphritea hakodatensis]